MPAFCHKTGDRFSFGASLPLFYRKLGDEKAFGFTLNAGGFYDAGFIQAGLLVRNISTLNVFWSTNTNESSLPAFRLGLSVIKGCQKALPQQSMQIPNTCCQKKTLTMAWGFVLP
jgi:hypothetical protein